MPTRQINAYGAGVRRLVSRSLRRPITLSRCTNWSGLQLATLLRTPSLRLLRPLGPRAVRLTPQRKRASKLINLRHLLRVKTRITDARRAQVRQGSKA